MPDNDYYDLYEDYQSRSKPKQPRDKNHGNSQIQDEIIRTGNVLIR